MTRVTFYLLQQQSSKAVQHFTCRLTDKAWRAGMPVHIHADSDEHCQALDQLLWTWREDSFLPHHVISQDKTDDLENTAPITLGHTDPGIIEGALLINLSASIPGFYRNFARTCEVVDQSPGPVEILRKKFRHYRADGVKPETHDIAAETAARGMA
ncbi:MAG: DNA polymerase III subunit chi [Endozoicomonas sp.]